jgi:hypothetical protein
MRLRSVNLGLALTLTLASTANASDGFPFLPQYDETSYEAVTLAIDSAERDAQILPENWAEPYAAAQPYGQISSDDWAEPRAAAQRYGQISPEDWVDARAELADPETTGAIPARIDHALTEPESYAIVDLAEAEPLPLQGISSFDLTLTAGDMPTAPHWDTL